jgi:hypothetical protein
MTTSSTKDVIPYLKSAMRLNPVWNSAELLELRRKQLDLRRLDTVQLPNLQEVGAKRDVVRKQIAQVQSEFWGLPLDQLQRALGAIDVKSVPEFAPVVTRLRTAAACRGEFPRLAQLPGMDLPLFNAFKSAVVLPPAEAGRVRDRFVRSIQDKKRLKEVQKAAKLVQSKYPILFALERDWFATISKLKGTSQIASREVDSGGGGFSFEMPWFGWWFLCIVIKVLLSGLIR